MGILEITLDGITAYTVNHLDSVPAVVNMVLHMCFLCSLDIMMFLMFLYLLDITRGIPKNRKKRILLMAPLVINLAIVIIFMPQLSYLHGNITNYSMGISAESGRSAGGRYAGDPAAPCHGAGRVEDYATGDRPDRKWKSDGDGQNRTYQ